MRAVTSNRTTHSSDGESAVARVFRHNNWVTFRVTSGDADIKSLADDHTEVRKHIGGKDKQLIHGEPLVQKLDYVARIVFEN